MNRQSGNGDLPAEALERLASMGSSAQQRGLFTSDLTVSEFLLIKEAGFDPLGLVLGVSIYHIGFQQSSWNQNQEMQVLTQATYHARELAMRRMEEEAGMLGADGIVGVRLTVSNYSWANDLAEFKAIGTAVKSRDGRDLRTRQGKPFTSDLSGQDFWILLRAGFRPVALVLGNCVYHVAHRTFRQWFRSVGRNVEMPNFTQALYSARELAMERMQRDAVSAGASGVVGANIHEHSHHWSTHVIEFLAVGTAIIAESAGHQIPTPQLTLSLNADSHPPSVVQGNPSAPAR